MVSHLGRKTALFLGCFVLLSIGAVLADNGPQHQAEQAFPIRLGTSGGNVNNVSRAFCCSGTLGALVTKNGLDYILSNNHILADSDQAQPGENISQPGLVDVGCNAASANIVAHFSEAPTLGSANVDAAIAAIVSSTVVDTSGSILDVGVPSSTSATPAVGLAVAKSGRTTGLTCAAVGSVSTNVRVQYQRGCGKGKKFTISYANQVLVNSSSFSAGGDSGSLIVTQSSAQPVALLFAGSSTTTIGNPIGDVTDALAVSFVGGANHSIEGTCPGPAAATTPVRGPLVGSVGRALLAKEKHADRLMQDEAVLGVGVGADPSDPSEAVVVIYVEQGRAHGPFPAELDGVRTHIIRTDEFRAFGWNEPAVRPCGVR